MTVPDYCSTASLQYAKHRILNPPDEKPYEHHVGSWACTMLGMVFEEAEWIITPEKVDQYSKKRPDLVVEKVLSNTQSSHYLFMELKASNGDRFEDALAQVVKEIAETLEDSIEAYIVVQRGTKIGFFEYHNDVSNLDEEDIPHFKGCISLTQKYSIQNNPTSIMDHLPNDLEPLFHDSKHLKKNTDTRAEAKDYEQKCVFDLEKHEKEINTLFFHMKTTSPRSSVWVFRLLCGILLEMVCLLKALCS